MHAIVFFDGACGVCNDFVIRTAQRDAQEKFSFAPLGGETAQELGIPGTDRVVLHIADDQGETRLYQRTAAILYIMKHQDSRFLRGVAGLLCWIPAPGLDLFGRAFARIRHLIQTTGRRMEQTSFAARMLP